MRQLNMLGFPEKKSRSVSIDNLTVSASAPSFIPLNNIEQGSGNNQRVGRQVRLHSLHVKIAFQTFTIDADIGRISIFWDMQHNSGETVLESPNLIFTDNPAYTSDVYGFRNLSNTKRFIMLWDKSFMLNSTAAYRDSSTTFSLQKGRFFDLNIPLKGQTVNYEGTGGSISEIATGVVYMLLQFTGGAGSGTQAVVKGGTRIRFTDV